MADEKLPPHWGEFDRGPSEPSAEQASVAALCARLLGGVDGQEFIAWLRRETKERVLGPNASNEALRDLEGARRLCDKIERMTAAGEAALRAKR